MERFARAPVLAVVMLMTACAAPSVQAPRGQVQYLTESSSVTTLLVVPPWTFVGTTEGLEIRDTRSGAVTRLGTAEGLMGDRVTALAAAGDTIWIASDGGLARYDLTSGTLAPLPHPAELEDQAQTGFRALAADGEGGAWVGASTGLLRVTGSGTWEPTGVRGAVTALAAVQGRLWVATPGALHLRGSDGRFTTYGKDRGFDIADSQKILSGPGKAITVVGRSGSEGRLAFFQERTFSTFRMSPADEPFDGASIGEGLLLLSRRRLYELAAPQIGERVVTGDRLFLESVAGDLRQSPYELLPVDLALPPEVTALATAGDEVLVGTRSLGIARLTQAAGKWTAEWSRRRDLMEGAIDLTIACEDARNCWVATGAQRAWRYDGRSLAPFSPAGESAEAVTTLAVVRSPEGVVYALYRLPGSQSVSIARKEGLVFEAAGTVVLEAPGGISAVSFAKFAPDGLLWVGLMAGPAEDARAWGVAIVDLALSTVFYHRESAARDAGVMPVPNDATDVSFRGEEEIWFATYAGAARVRGGEVKVFNENDGLETELINGIVATASGFVFAATSHGIGVFDGSRWKFPGELAVHAESIAQDRNGRLWIGTPKGLFVYDGSTLKPAAPRLGLVGRVVHDVAVDHYGRVWVRSSDGIAIVTP